MRFAFHLSLLLCLPLLFAGCDDDDGGGGQMGVPLNSFDISGTNFPTDFGYLIYDDGPPYNNAFGVLLNNSACRTDTISGISCEISSTQAVVLWVENGGAQVATEANVTLPLGPTVVGEETTALTNISAYTDTYAFGSDTYGQIDETGATIYEVGSAGSGTLTIQSITTDFTRREAQVDLTYSFTANGQLITGAFNGRLDMLNGF